MCYDGFKRPFFPPTTIITPGAAADRGAERENERKQDMRKYAEMTREELQAELEQVKARYEELKARGQSLNMARGKPSKAQLDMNGPMMDILRSDSDYLCDGIDVRNYGNLEGLPSCRQLFAELLDVKPENVFIGGSASLQLM